MPGPTAKPCRQGLADRAEETVVAARAAHRCGIVHAGEGIRIERIYPDTTVEVNIDPGRMRQVFLNLIINAIQAMQGGGKLTMGICEVEGDKVLVCFEDTGHGIRETDLHKIFDFYYSTKEDGTGLGLAIVQQIVEEHQGRVIVKSELHEGTKFILELPKSTQDSI